MDKGTYYPNCSEHNSLFDVFGGTGIVTASMLDITENNVINDFLYSNEVFYKAFFSQEQYDTEKLNGFVIKYGKTDRAALPDNYVSENYGDK